MSLFDILLVLGCIGAAVGSLSAAIVLHFLRADFLLTGEGAIEQLSRAIETFSEQHTGQGFDDSAVKREMVNLQAMLDDTNQRLNSRCAALSTRISRVQAEMGPNLDDAPDDPAELLEHVRQPVPAGRPPILVPSSSFSRR